MTTPNQNLITADYPSGSQSFDPAKAGSAVMKITNPVTKLEELSAADKQVLTNSGYGPLYSKLRAAFISQQGRNPFDFPSTATQPLVSSVTIDDAAIATSVVYGYFNSGGYDRLRLLGFPYKDTSLMLANASGSAVCTNPSGPSGGGYAGMAASNNQNGYLVLSKVTCSQLQVEVNSFGLSSNYFPIYVNGVAVAPTPAAVTTRLTVNFAVRGTYDLAVGFEQSLGVVGIRVSEDDTVHPVADIRIPIYMYGDSYVSGTTSPQVIGGASLHTAISLIGGVNVIPHGVSGTGYIADLASSGITLTFAGRLQYAAAGINLANAPITIVPAGLNDVSAGANTAAIQAAATTVYNYLLTNTNTKIIATGAMPGKNNNSTGTQNVDAGIAAAVAAINDNRLAFVPISGSVPPWVSGTRDTAHTTGLVAGNSRYFTGNDSLHLSPFITSAPALPANTTPSSGVEYLARKLLDAIHTTALARGW